MQNDAPQSPNRHARTQSVSTNPQHLAFGIPGFDARQFRSATGTRSTLAAAAASSASSDAPRQVDNQRLISLFKQMHTVISTLADNYKKDCGNSLEGNDETTLLTLKDIAKVIKETIDKEGPILNSERYTPFITRLKVVQANAKKSKGWFSNETSPTALAGVIGSTLDMLEKNKTNYEVESQRASERAEQEVRRKADEDIKHKLESDLEARRKEDDERSRKFAAEMEVQRKAFDEELKRRSEQEEIRRREDQQRQEAAFRSLQESLEAQRKEAHEAQRRAEREFERRMEQTLREVREKDQTIHELRSDLKKKDDEKDETIRELRQRIAGYESQRSQIAASKAPAATPTQLPVLAPSNSTLDKYFGKKHTEIFKELCKLRNYPKLQAVVESMIKTLFFEFQKPIGEEFFTQLFAVQLDTSNSDEKSSIEALTNFKANYQKNIDSGDGDQNTHKLHLKTLYAQVTATITANKTKLPDGTTVESYIFSRLGEDIDSLISSPISGLSKGDLKGKAQSLRDEAKRERPAESKLAMPSNNGNGH